LIGFRTPFSSKKNNRLPDNILLPAWMSIYCYCRIDYVIYLT
jgi:hypothetical protein